MEIEKSFLPNIEWLRLENCQIDSMNSEIWLNVTLNQALAHCPVCHQLNNRVHSKYERIVKDLPWGEHEVKWQLAVRKFFCTNPKCQRKIFTERLPEIVNSWARKTCRLAQGQTLIALALGGIAGSRLTQELGYTTSRQTLLRLIAKLPLETQVNPTVVGIDDWASTKREELW
jgi:transposase